MIDGVPVSPVTVNCLAVLSQAKLAESAMVVAEEVYGTLPAVRPDIPPQDCHVPTPTPFVFMQCPLTGALFIVKFAVFTVLAYTEASYEGAPNCDA